MNKILIVAEHDGSQNFQALRRVPGAWSVIEVVAVSAIARNRNRGVGRAEEHGNRRVHHGLVRPERRSSGGEQSEIGCVEEWSLLQLREQACQGSENVPQRTKAVALVGLGNGREDAVPRCIGLQCDSQLLQVVGALHPPRRLAGRLDRR